MDVDTSSSSICIDMYFSISFSYSYFKERKKNFFFFLLIFKLFCLYLLYIFCRALMKSFFLSFIQNSWAVFSISSTLEMSSFLCPILIPFYSTFCYALNQCLARSFLLFYLFIYFYFLLLLCIFLHFTNQKILAWFKHRQIPFQLWLPKIKQSQAVNAIYFFSLLSLLAET